MGSILHKQRYPTPAQVFLGICSHCLARRISFVHIPLCRGLWRDEERVWPFWGAALALLLSMASASTRSACEPEKTENAVNSPE